MTVHFKLAAAAAALSALLAACSPAADKTEGGEATATAVQASADVQPFKVGTLDVIALRDGGMTGVPNDNTVLAVDRTPQEVAAVLTAAGLPGDSFDLSIQPLLVRDGDAVVLIDAGAGAAMGAAAGKLPASLRAAGVEPGQVTDVLISHGHGDHVGGLVDANGALTFPNATIRMTEAEWAALKADASMAAVVTAITPKVETFAANAQVTPSIKAYAIDGHTPGHTGYEIVSGGERLLYIGDMAHHHVISVQRPDWTIQFDGNADLAEASRKAVFGRAADGNLRVYAVHFPFPGVGRVRREGETFVWVPEAPARP
ncbi:MAG: MBL fold metallo-hydrolase [Alphaproteobacteria bacterium]|nr:MBL fold metallo-hydrolase [Alphaproteobacteria bacterium]MBU1525360.1 MBL fold metallo-hydrolase [Alphaproteobacteria bacterium]MBU2352488.1 MBL fold metallo-hydrolase [Alphaproteobacteria bacterium]MBU2382409.1 MBL fold metallo-hydrolase [Alphaproteobacteria bacterium]